MGIRTVYGVGYVCTTPVQIVGGVKANLNPRHPPHRDASRHAPPRRSALYMPARQRPRARQGRGLDADVLILDLEDAVAPDAKPQARAQVAAALQAGGYGRRECVARINALDTPWGLDDARALAAAGATPCCCPGRKPGPAGRAGAGIDAAGAPPTFPCGPCAKRRWAFCVWTPSPAIPGWRPGRGHVGPGQGSACAPHAGPRGNAAGAFAGHHGRPRPRTGGVGWRAPGPGR